MSPEPISYSTEPRKRSTISREWKTRIAIALALIISAVIAPRMMRRASYLQQMHNVSTFTPAQDLLAGTLNLDGNLNPPRIGPTNWASSRFPSLFNFSAPLQTLNLFAGALEDSGKAKHICLVSLTPMAVFPKDYIAYKWQFADKDRGVYSGGVSGIRLPSAKSYRFFVGSRDPNNGSHLIIHFTYDNTEGIIDGYLNDDGTMTLELREPPTTSPG